MLLPPAIDQQECTELQQRKQTLELQYWHTGYCYSTDIPVFFTHVSNNPSLCLSAQSPSVVTDTYKDNVKDSVLCSIVASH